MAASGVIDKLFRYHVSPVLRDHGFERVNARNAWARRPTCILVFNIRAVGRYHSDVTGWPASSVWVWLGAHYPFIPDGGRDKMAADGRLLPAEVDCHMRGHLTSRLDQTASTGHLANPQERVRRDVWWVEPDGSNAEVVALDIAGALREDGLARYERWSDLTLALEELAHEHDCYIKFLRAYHVAKALGDDVRTAGYRELLIAEGIRIGQAPVL